VVEGIDTAEPAGVDQSHEDVADVGARSCTRQTAYQTVVAECERALEGPMRAKVQVLFVECMSDRVRVDLAVKDVWTDTLTVRQVDSGTGKWGLYSEKFLGPVSCSSWLLRVIRLSRRRGDARLSIILKADDASPEAWTDTI